MAYTESDFIIPALQEMRKRSPNGITTSELIAHLREVLEPSGYDLEIANFRNDDHFSEKVRNLNSHKNGVIHALTTKEPGRNGNWRINDAGINYIEKFEGVDVALRDQGFTEKQRKAALKPTNTQFFIEEGEVKITSRAIRKRSLALRKAAFKQYAGKDGKVCCHGCGFEGSGQYGENGVGLIEMHHTTPIASQAGGNLKKTLAEAIFKVAPLCPNCHRVVHRGKELLSLKKLRIITGYKMAKKANEPAVAAKPKN